MKTRATSVVSGCEQKAMASLSILVSNWSFDAGSSTVITRPWLNNSIGASSR